MSLRKIDYSQKLIENWIDKLKCPHCDEALSLSGKNLVCSNNHQFDASKQGVYVLLKSSLKDDKLYNRELFESRRCIMEAGMYESVYPHLLKYIKEDDYVLDMGSGEATHDKMLRSAKDFHILGIDLAKEGVKLSSDFFADGVLSLVSDLSRLPIQSESIDVILNILSPSNELEMARVLKDDGLVLKLVPKENYLIELRESLGMEKYSPLDPNFKLFNCVERISIKDIFELKDDLFFDLLNMTPLTHHQTNAEKLSQITLDLEVWVLKKN